MVVVEVFKLLLLESCDRGRSLQGAGDTRRILGSFLLHQDWLPSCRSKLDCGAGGWDGGGVVCFWLQCSLVIFGKDIGGSGQLGCEMWWSVLCLVVWFVLGKKKFVITGCYC